MIEFGFRMMRRIMHISEDVLVPLRPSASVDNILLDQNSSYCLIKPPQIPRNRYFSPLSRIVSLGHLRRELPLACMAWQFYKTKSVYWNTFRVHSEGPHCHWHCSRVTPKQAYNICLFLRKPNPRKNDSRSRELKRTRIILLSTRD